MTVTEQYNSVHHWPKDKKRNGSLPTKYDQLWANCLEMGSDPQCPCTWTCTGLPGPSILPFISEQSTHNFHTHLPIHQCTGHIYSVLYPYISDIPNNSSTT